MLKGPGENTVMVVVMMIILFVMSMGRISDLIVNHCFLGVLTIRIDVSTTLC